jgi:hypothetical protein
MCGQVTFIAKDMTDRLSCIDHRIGQTRLREDAFSKVPDLLCLE